MNKALTTAERDLLLRDIDQIVAWSRDAIGLARRLREAQPEFYDRFGAARANMMALTDANGGLDFYHGGLRAKDAGRQDDLRPRRLPQPTASCSASRSSRGAI